MLFQPTFSTLKIIFTEKKHKIHRLEQRFEKCFLLMAFISGLEISFDNSYYFLLQHNFRMLANLIRLIVAYFLYLLSIFWMFFKKRQSPEDPSPITACGPVVITDIDWLNHQDLQQRTTDINRKLYNSIENVDQDCCGTIINSTKSTEMNCNFSSQTFGAKNG